MGHGLTTVSLLYTCAGIEQESTRMVGAGSLTPEEWEVTGDQGENDPWITDAGWRRQ